MCWDVSCVVSLRLPPPTSAATPLRVRTACGSQFGMMGIVTFPLFLTVLKAKFIIHFIKDASAEKGAAR